MLRASTALFLVSGFLVGCGGAPGRWGCHVKSLREVEWDHAPRNLGFSADDFADVFRRDWHWVVPWHDLSRELYVDPLPASYQSMWQDWFWTWEPDRGLPVRHQRLDPSLPMRCPVYPLGNPAGLEQLLIPGRSTGESADGVWAFEGTQYLWAFALPTEQEPIYVASAVRDLSEPQINSAFTKTHPEFWGDVEAQLQALEGDWDEWDVDVFLEGDLRQPGMLVRAQGNDTWATLGSPTVSGPAFVPAELMPTD